MDKAGFKIGDRVKIVPRYINFFPQADKIGTVKGFGGSYILVTYNNCHYSDGFPYKPLEIELAVRKGEQLLFSFMKED